MSINRRFVVAVLMVLIGVTVSADAAAQEANNQGSGAKDTCLMFVARNISTPGDNFFLYEKFSNRRMKIKKGDVLEYDIYLAQSNPIAGGAIDIETNSGNLRDSGSMDQNGLLAHPDTILKQAVGKWYHREIPLDKLAGQRAQQWSIAAEGDARGTYIEFFDNVLVKHTDGSSTVIYANGRAPAHQILMKNGYSKSVVLKPVARAEVADNVDLTRFIDVQVQQFLLRDKLDDLRDQLALADSAAKQVDDKKFASQIAEGKSLIDAAEKDKTLTADSIKTAWQRIDSLLGQDEPAIKQYTAHLVGHAHIDFQWLWEWPETVQVCRNTFGDALRFIHEYPGFKFTQSSAGLYQATQKSWPKIFKGIQEQVAAGNWEIVGGRITEGDENMLSPEAHAMQFLYGQRYFRKNFKGVSAKVGWEPDTFGHTLQFPQILNLAGCKYFYFCRAGYHFPLFWWQAPDGSRVLAFNQSATGGWYDGDITTKRIERSYKFADKTGSKDSVWVYGVGDHGGGPTRENIKTALAYQKLPFVPTIKFSTAYDFFKSLGKYNLSKLPVVTTDLNTPFNCGFNGVWTTHSDVKRWNRDAEATTESAEAIAYFASRYADYPYPAGELRRDWTDICWNHHHDTISGTAFHDSYFRTAAIYQRVIASSRQIEQDALSFLAVRVKSGSDGFLVFNPCGWTRSGLVQIPDPQAPGTMAVSAEDTEPVQSDKSGHGLFFVKDIPSFSYRVYRFEQAKQSPKGLVSVSSDGTVLENSDFRVVLDPSRGVVSSVYDKRNKWESIASGGSGNRLEIHWENPKGSSAWTISHIDRVQPLVSPVKVRITESGPARVTVSWDRVFQSTRLHQSISLAAHGAPVFSLATQWKELGGPDHDEPFLKVAFDVNAQQPKATYQVPFATIQKPTDGAEHPALKFADLSDENDGAAILNDCKQGYSADGNTLRLSLIRTTFYPDPRPNDRPQHASWSFLPHGAGGVSPAVVKAAESFNHPLLGTEFHPMGQASLPMAKTFLSVSGANVLITGVKKAEDDGDLIVRFYELMGQPTKTTVQLPELPRHIETVNLIEDPLHSDPTTTIQLGSHEIRTLKIEPHGP